MSDGVFNHRHTALWGGGFPGYQTLQKRGYSRDHMIVSLRRPHFKIQPQSPDALQLALIEIIGLRATVAKDYIYGLIGLMDGVTRAQLSVDYSASDASVFAQAVRVACSQNNGASTLPAIWEFYREV